MIKYGFLKIRKLKKFLRVMIVNLYTSAKYRIKSKSHFINRSGNMTQSQVWVVPDVKNK